MNIDDSLLADEMLHKHVSQIPVLSIDSQINTT